MSVLMTLAASIFNSYLVSWSLTSLFSRNMTRPISERKVHYPRNGRGLRSGSNDPCFYRVTLC